MEESWRLSAGWVVPALTRKNTDACDGWSRKEMRA